MNLIKEQKISSTLLHPLDLFSFFSWVFFFVCVVNLSVIKCACHATSYVSTYGKHLTLIDHIKGSCSFFKWISIIIITIIIIIIIIKKQKDVTV